MTRRRSSRKASLKDLKLKAEIQNLNAAAKLAGAGTTVQKLIIWKDFSVAIIAAVASFLGASAAKTAQPPPSPPAMERPADKDKAGGTTDIPTLSNPNPDVVSAHIFEVVRQGRIYGVVLDVPLLWSPCCPVVTSFRVV